jgi:hypothetical protein
VFAVSSYAESSPVAAALREGFANVRVEPVDFDKLVCDVEHNWLLLANEREHERRRAA